MIELNLVAETNIRPEHGTPPLVVDLEGALNGVDISIEAFVELLASRPLRALSDLAASVRGRGAFNGRVAADAVLTTKRLLIRGAFHDFLLRERKAGRKIFLLTTAAGYQQAEVIARELGIFEGVVAPDACATPGETTKAEAVCAAFGEGGFDYVGSGDVDFAVCEKARAVMAAAVPASVARVLSARYPEAQQIDDASARPGDYLRALRVHQWVKNILIFIPAFAAHKAGLLTTLELSVAFFSFCCAASSAYLVNDLLDLPSDRSHPTKRYRPIASSKISLTTVLALIPSLLAAAMLLAAFLPIEFMMILGGYYFVTIGYSLWIKRRMTGDVITLACLYGARLIAGGAAVGVTLSPWLIAFATFLFLSLAFMKRCTELIDRGESGNPTGRSYILHDLPILEAMAVASGFVAVMVFALYLNSPTVIDLYRHPERLWFICVIMLYWLSRVFVRMHRGEMHADPIVFAMTDRASLVSGAAVIAIVLMSL